jgi:hypothetical protein
MTPARIENSELTIVSFFIVKWIVCKKGFVATYVGGFTKIAYAPANALSAQNI